MEVLVPALVAEDAGGVHGVRVGERLEQLVEARQLVRTEALLHAGQQTRARGDVALAEDHARVVAHQLALGAVVVGGRTRAPAVAVVAVEILEDLEHEGPGLLAEGQELRIHLPHVLEVREQGFGLLLPGLALHVVVLAVDDDPALGDVALVPLAGLDLGVAGARRRGQGGQREQGEQAEAGAGERSGASHRSLDFARFGASGWRRCQS